jgi:hypothetical protein
MVVLVENLPDLPKIYQKELLINPNFQSAG